MPYKNIEDKKKRDKIRYEKNREKLLLINKEWRNSNKEYLKEYADKNKDKKKIYRKEYYSTNKEKQKKYELENKEKIKEYRKNWREKNKERIKETRKKYKNISNEKQKDRMKNDIHFKIRMNLSRRFSNAVKKSKTIKDEKTLELLGCSLQELKSYLELRFKEGMSWENYSLRGWHIDHIKPCASFDLSDPEQQKQCFHYSNLQPLWWYENLSKGDKAIGSDL
jgi:hypothetical protein